MLSDFRGASSGETEAFRNAYDKLVDIRSILGNSVPFITLTATATPATTDYIITKLQLINPSMIVALPKKDNIKYFVIKTKTTNPNQVFAQLIEDLSSNGYSTNRTIIFFRKMSDMRSVYKTFFMKFKKSYKDYIDRPFAMFHSQTSEEIKEHILDSFKTSNGSVRVLLATIAFGMGVDCVGLNTVIHFGPPSSMEDYFQETGRAGRDGKQSYAVLVNYPRSTQSKIISKSMKDYIKNNSVCRRRLLLKTFGDFDHHCSQQMLPVNCCDICDIERSIKAPYFEFETSLNESDCSSSSSESKDLSESEDCNPGSDTNF